MIRENKAGELASKAGDPADFMFVIFYGMLRGEHPETHQLFTASAGTVTGLLPFSRLTHFPRQHHCRQRHPHRRSA